MPPPTNSTLFVGDVHGNFKALATITKTTTAKQIIVVGDFGYGFPRTFHATFKPKTPIAFIRGNHDNPSVRKGFKWPGFSYIHDGSFKDGQFFVGGAYSIDYKQRVPGLDWWPEEELSDHEWESVFAAAHKYKAKIHTVVTHDCPWSLYPRLHAQAIDSRTARGLDELWRLLPEVKLWIFGHHHKSFRETVGNTAFIGLDLIESGDSLLVQ
jgi:Icc-related predicted phosphoesterase